jgi:hypothetical protein
MPIALTLALKRPFASLQGKGLKWRKEGKEKENLRGGVEVVVKTNEHLLRAKGFDGTHA